MAWTAPEVRGERRRATSPDGTEVPYFLLSPRRPPARRAPGRRCCGATAGSASPSWRPTGPTCARLARGRRRGGDRQPPRRRRVRRRVARRAAGCERKQNVFDDFAAVADHLVADGRHHARAARAARRQQRRPAGRRDAHPAAGPGRGGAACGRRDGHAALPPVHDRCGVDLRLRLAGRPGDVRGAAGLLAAAQPARRGRRTRRRWCSPATTTTGWCRRTASSSPRRCSAAQAGDAPVLARIETSTGHGAGQAALRGRRRRPPTCWPSPPSTPGWCRASRRARLMALPSEADRRFRRSRTPCPSLRAARAATPGTPTIRVRRASSDGAEDPDGEQPALRALPTATVATGHAGRHLHDREQRVHAVEVLQRRRARRSPAAA